MSLECVPLEQILRYFPHSGGCRRLDYKKPFFNGIGANGGIFSALALEFPKSLCFIETQGVNLMAIPFAGQARACRSRIAMRRTRRGGSVVAPTGGGRRDCDSCFRFSLE